MSTKYPLLGPSRVALLACVAIACVSLEDVAFAQTTSQPVTVTNTPLPVSGSVTVNNPSTSPIPVVVNQGARSSVIRVSVTNPVNSVTVNNPASSPVLTSNTSDPGRMPYQAQQNPTCANQGGTGTTWLCQATFTAVPSGKRLVIQNVAWSAFPSSAPSAVWLDLFGNFVAYLKYIPSAMYSVPGFSVLQIDSNLTVYADAGALNVAIYVYGVTTLGNNQPINLTGYLIECAVGSCAPIVTQ